MKIITLRVGQLGTNCYLIESDEKVGIIDPGDDGGYIIDQIQRLELSTAWILATHGHFDHVLAAMELSLTFKIPFYIHPKDEFLLKNSHDAAFYFTKVKTEPFLIKPNFIKENDVLKIGSSIFKIIEVPGHTPGSICLYSKSENVLFCGDLVFAGGNVGRTDFKYSSEDNLWRSIKKILKRSKNTKIFPGHGENLELGDLRFS